MSNYYFDRTSQHLLRKLFSVSLHQNSKYFKMQILRSLLKTNPQLIRNVVQPRNMSGIAVPARNKVTKGEMIFLASIMMSSWLVIPGWVLVNMKNYRAHE